MIEKFVKVYYVCMNIECDQMMFDEFEYVFKFNDVVLCYFIVKMKKVEIGLLLMMKEVQCEEVKKVVVVQLVEVQV